jgi:hypothetical protein
VKLGYSEKLRTNYLVVERGNERSIALVARRAAMHACDRRDVSGIVRYAVAIIGDSPEPELLSRKQLEKRGFRP